MIAPDAADFLPGSTADAPVGLLRLIQGITSHLVVGVIALIVIGGSTRVMEAGLACPDWPLCYGSLLPGKQMNLQVFLDWFGSAGSQLHCCSASILSTPLASLVHFYGFGFGSDPGRSWSHNSHFPAGFK
jgi:hypothetical protein